MQSRRRSSVRKYNKTSFQTKLLFLPFLLLLWPIIKLGQTATKLITFLFEIFYSLVKVAKAPRLNFKIPKFPHFSPTLRRGRPRTRPFKTYFLYKNRRFIKRILPAPLRVGVFGVMVVLVIFSYSLFLIEIAHDLPSPQKLSVSQKPLTSEIYDRHGQVLYRLYEGKNRTLTNIDDLPDYLIKATIAIEDKNFYAHSGVDLVGIVRALSAYLQNRQIQGGSTITQQLIKNTLLTPEKTLKRKIKEVALAFWAERIFSKKEILQMYFNEVPYGGPAWGIEAAAQIYFGKKAADLNLAEASYLAGLPASPTTYSPYGVSSNLGKLRQKEVLRRMVEDGYISLKLADEAYSVDLDIKPPVSSIKAPHFVMYVRSVLAQKYGDKTVSQGGLRIITSLDLNVQNLAENIVAEEVSKLAALRVGNGAAMVTDPRNGQILAMVGSKNYWEISSGNYNVALALRQPGSSIKPVTYASAFKIGYSPATFMLDAQVSFKSAWETYSPVNYDGKFHGPIPIRVALGSSYNVPAVKMLALVGIPQMIQTAHDLGITTFNDPQRYGLSLTLGGGEVRLIDMMTVYSTFSQLGTRFDPQPILKVTDSSGMVLEDNTNPQGKRVLSSGVAYLITDILADNNARTPAFGANSQLHIPGRIVAVKTGTSDNKRDNWCFGYTPDLVVGVWVGNNNNAQMDPTLSSGITGATPIWARLMTELLKNRPNLAFTRPAEVIEGIVDEKKDLLISGTVPKSVIGKVKNKDAIDQSKETITFTDPFSTYKVDQPPTNP